MSPGQQLPSTSTYLIGVDPAAWRTHVPNYARATFHDVYAGIDLSYHGNAGLLEYDFLVAPGADPGAIELRLDGAESASIENGELVAHTAAADLVQRRPTAFQDFSGTRQPVDAGYSQSDDGQIRLWVGHYDRNRSLVIDPVIGYSTYFGGAHNDTTFGIAVDRSGSAYITGETNSPTFTGVGAGALQSQNAGGFDAFVIKLNPAGTAVDYATYIGGTGTDQAFAIAVDRSGNAYITGQTDSPTFPGIGPSSIQPTKPDGAVVGFVLKLNPAGDSIVYSTFLGTTSGDGGFGIAADDDGNAYVTGQTDSATFPGVSARSIQPAKDKFGNAFVIKINADGSEPAYSTFLGGSGGDQGFAIAVDPEGNAYVTGDTGSADFPGITPGQTPPPILTVRSDAFITKINSRGSRIVYSRFLGGSDGNATGRGVTADSAGNAYIAGITSSTAFTGVGPRSIQSTHTPNTSCGFITKISPNGSDVVYSTFFGDAPLTEAESIAIDTQHNAYVAGFTAAATLPGIGPASLQSTGPSGHDGFFTRINAAGTAATYTTYLGGAGTSQAGNQSDAVGIGLDRHQNAYIAGGTRSNTFLGVGPGSLQPIERDGPDGL